jgi:hypothetical protein
MARVIGRRAWRWCRVRGALASVDNLRMIPSRFLFVVQDEELLFHLQTIVLQRNIILIFSWSMGTQEPDVRLLPGVHYAGDLLGPG